MKLEIRRRWLTDKSTIGELHINGNMECFTLEDTVREVAGKPVSEWKVDGKTAIPSGTYKVVIDKSVRFRRWMFHILDVPGFDGVRIHPGNTDADTVGCVLVGTKHELNAVLYSRIAYSALIEKVARITGYDAAGDAVWELFEPCEITILNDPIADSGA